jgi:beta-phosphoglucomutase-like phosphatase (HAD superfamily)
MRGTTTPMRRRFARKRPAGRALREDERIGADVPVGPEAEEHGSLEGSPDVDALAGRWWAAFEAAQSALRSAGRYLGAQEVGERGRRLAEERSEVVQLLQGLARDRHVEALLVQWLATPGITPRLLGLPDGVVACVFDLDGVLITSATVHAAAWADTFDPFLLARVEPGRDQPVPFDRHREYQTAIAGRSRLAGIRAFLASRGISLPEGGPGDPPGAHTVHGLANRKNEALQRRLDREGVTAFEGSRAYLEAAHLLGLHCAVVSASANTQIMLERAGLAHLIDERIDGKTIEAEQLEAKPAPDTLLAACRRLHVEPHQTVAFETTPVGIAAARAAGMRLVVGVDRPGDTVALDGSDADLVVGDLAELLGRT